MTREDKISGRDVREDVVTDNFKHMLWVAQNLWNRLRIIFLNLEGRSLKLSLYKTRLNLLSIKSERG